MVFIGGILSNIVTLVKNLLEPSVAFKVTLGGSSNDAATPITQSEEVKSPSETSSATSVSEETISHFISQVSSLVKYAFPFVYTSLERLFMNNHDRLSFVQAS